MVLRRTSARARLAGLGVADVAAADRVLDRVDAAGTVAAHLGLAADPDLALRSLERVVAAAGRGADELVASVAEDPELARRLVVVLGASAGLADHLVRHPDDWRELADPLLDRVRPTPGALADTLGRAAGRDALRREYRRLLLRLAARDLGLSLAVEDAAAELSDLAAAALGAALGIARAEVGAQADEVRLAVVALGKCGGHELNYVSDVDVLFVAEPVGSTAEPAALAAGTALAATLIRVCSDHTGEGALWPVDAALRPEGAAGPLVRTLGGYATYYERWAKTWEFQALLKARPVAGDSSLGQRFVELVEPLVWSAADRPGFVADVQAMRRRVVDNIPPPQALRQLKLGPGGLRDVEFAVQLLQLVHGRGDASLRSPNTLAALAALTAGGYVGREDGAALADAYRFLRTLEHRLQLSRLRRTHLLPTDAASLRALGRSVGLTTEPADQLADAWAGHAREVRRLHEKLFYRPLLAAVAALPGDQARLSPAAAASRLAALGYLDPTAALQHLEALTAGVSRRAAIQRSLLPVMLGWFAAAPAPDAGLLAFRQLSDALGSTHWYLGLLRDESLVAERLAGLLATSRYAVDLLLRAPEAMALLGRDDDLQPRPGEMLQGEIAAAAGRHACGVEAVAAIRALRRRELFRVAAADLLGLADVAAVGEALTTLAGACLAGALAAATGAVEGRYGGPLPARLAIVALGRLGGHELAYGSDADVLFVHDPVPGAGEEAAARAATAVAGELIRLLAAPGPEPALVVDAGLRPEGRQGPLVRSLASYAAYYARWSRPWEAQALLRAEPLAGDVELGERFVELVDPVRYPVGGLSADELTEVRRLKARVDAERLPRGADPATHLKFGRGGLADVEWTAQLLQLRYAAADARLRTTSTLAALGGAQDAGLLTAQQEGVLSNAWRLATRLRNASMLVKGRPSDALPSSAADLRALAYVCGYPLGEVGRLEEDYRRAARRASTVVQDVFWS
ncbi:MAG TPA: bifunctional [glutamine synthetase] adenylyltransferase/[glutamine synthetase]-adenylyl-L-tyrosine phosphorylase [Nocardioidaceae bacterium]|nr:bifunctional [glutamine synthetase] adenylyltransferase/[glutamine synthetase]-adenylyl-L-tyrosine phosphorylase [Nocardioidaceae bacterium]